MPRQGIERVRSEAKALSKLVQEQGLNILYSCLPVDTFYCVYL